jgi:hypothetical protein
VNVSIHYVWRKKGIDFLMMMIFFFSRNKHTKLEFCAVISDGNFSILLILSKFSIVYHCYGLLVEHRATLSSRMKKLNHNSIYRINNNRRRGKSLPKIFAIDMLLYQFYLHNQYSLRAANLHVENN